MKDPVTTSLVQADRLNQLQQCVFDTLDVSYTTRQDYASRIKHFIRYLGDSELNCRTFLEYKRFLEQIDTYSISTKNKYLISARVFLDTLYKMGVIPIRITDNVRSFSQGSLHKKDGLNDSDIQKIQDYCATLAPTHKTIRLKAILALLIFQGLRQIEISRLNVNDIDLKNRCAYILGKGRDDKERIHLHPHTIKALKEYLQSIRFRDGALFRSQSNFSNGSRLTTKSIREEIKRLLDTLQIDGSTHGFRHYFITKLIRSYKGELLMVSKYSRHRSIQMLEVYNDEIIREEDLPRYYEVFNNISI